MTEKRFTLKGDNMRNDNFKTILRSYDETEDETLSRVEILCKDFETFKEIVEKITPILQKEDIEECPKVKK